MLNSCRAMSPLHLGRGGWPCLGVLLVPMGLQGQLLPALVCCWHIGSDPLASPLAAISHLLCQGHVYCLLFADFLFLAAMDKHSHVGCEQTLLIWSIHSEGINGANSHHYVDFTIPVLIY